MAKKTYSISELAAQLDLPRTTINDWLKNFSSYLEYEMRGKRKEYNQNALNVLQNISHWKNEGKSASAIQKLLEEKFGILGEVDADPATANPNISENIEKTSNNVSDSGELMQVVHSDLEMLLANVEKLNEKRIKSTRRAAWGSVILMLLILAGVAAIAYFVYLNMQKIQKENSIAKQEYIARIQTLQSENKKQLDEINGLRKIELKKLNSNFDMRNEKFQKELKLQKEQLEEAFKKLEKSVAAQREAEMIKLRETFAKEQKEALEKLIASEKQLTSAQEQLKSMQQNSEKLRKENTALSSKLKKEQSENDRLEKLNKSLSDSMKQIKAKADK